MTKLFLNSKTWIIFRLMHSMDIDLAMKIRKRHFKLMAQRNSQYGDFNIKISANSF